MSDLDTDIDEEFGMFDALVWLEGIAGNITAYAVAEYRDRSGYRGHVQKLKENGAQFVALSIGRERWSRRSDAVIVVIEGDNKSIEETMELMWDDIDSAIEDGFAQKCGVWFYDGYSILDLYPPEKKDSSA